jgi:GNAT superfamily N-acetyltransferase
VTRPPVEVRRATVEDLDDLLLLWTQARDDLARGRGASSGPPVEQLRPRLMGALAAAETYVLVGRYEGAPVGYALLRLAPVLAVDANALHVDHLFVLPDCRRRGVARALLVAATAIAERHGADQVLAGAPPSAKDTHRFLARLGFSPLVVRRVVATSVLRRRLAGEGGRRGLEDLLSRRRSLRARLGRATAATDPEHGEPDPTEPDPAEPDLARAADDPTADAPPEAIDLDLADGQDRCAVRPRSVAPGVLPAGVALPPGVVPLDVEAAEAVATVPAPPAGLPPEPVERPRSRRHRAQLS